ncbi:DUF1178 family protein [Rhizobium sp. TRM96647]|uniref:DUF1178 family protein n=1 Tax=unclassified Rhizobium TaxID=2613769 RepID=UPI001E4C57B2|nr:MULTISPECIES: DUF1178 family protein [unclassified Rhizobium]MCD2182251.1 DUF1178 family protein [Rhizobium sp. GN54]MCV3734581.1 DUF1178 family protein [Rhizobium sp. TRM96647]MCV3756951.1 DUF1178 family protein [Rhizobium sp. TRM96650]
MIRYDIVCDNAHEFEGWFGSSEDFDRQRERSLVSCPTCGSPRVTKRLMAPSVSTARKKEERRHAVMTAHNQEMVGKLRELVTAIRANAEDVGERFPEEARKIHYGEAEQRGLIGKATAQEARELIEEGVEIAPLPVLPDETN